VRTQIWIKGATNPEQVRERAKQDPTFRHCLLEFISNVVTESMPTRAVDEADPTPGHRVFQPLLHPDHPHFCEGMAIDIYDLANSRQMHSVNHTPTCFKYSAKKRKGRRFHFPRALVPITSFDPATGVIQLRRDHEWLNGFNEWILMVTRSNHDCQFLLSKHWHHVLAAVHYVIKYISKPEASLHSRLTIAAAIRRALQSSSTSDIVKTMLLKTYNKLDSHREVSIPEAISHLLQFPDHFTDAVFQNVHTTRLLEYLRPSRPSRRTVTTAPALSVQHDDTLHPSEARQGDVDPLDAEVVVVDKRYRMLSAFEDYACRGDALQGYCLYDYHSPVYKKAGRTSGLIFAARHPQHATYRQFLRAGPPAIPIGRLYCIEVYAGRRLVIICV
jgi:hypothetical protein